MMRYPTYIEYEGCKYPINYDFRIALECMKLLGDKSLDDTERTVAIITMLFGEKISINHESLEMARKFLQCGSKVERVGGSTSEKDMDFEQDMGIIEASFMSDYNIDLFEMEEMHWWKFCNLISGLKPNSILNRIREIRNYDIAGIKDEKSRRKIIEAKNRVALKVNITEEEKDMLDEFEGLFE